MTITEILNLPKLVKKTLSDLSKGDISGGVGNYLKSVPTLKGVELGLKVLGQRTKIAPIKSIAKSTSKGINWYMQPAKSIGGGIGKVASKAGSTPVGTLGIVTATVVGDKILTDIFNSTSAIDTVRGLVNYKTADAVLRKTSKPRSFKEATPDVLLGGPLRRLTLRVVNSLKQQDRKANEAKKTNSGGIK